MARNVKLFLVTYTNKLTGQTIELTQGIDFSGFETAKEAWANFHENCRVMASHRNRLNWKQYSYSYREVTEAEIHATSTRDEDEEVLF